MRILHVTDHFGPVGGAERYLQLLLEWLAAEGHEQTLACADSTADHSSISSLRIATLPGLSDYSSSAGKRLEGRFAQVIENFEPDVASLHTAQINRRLAAVLIERVPTIFHAHNAATYCPGHGKYWEKSDSGCDVSYGPGCYRHALLERCADRRPWRFIHGYRRVVHASEWLPKVDGLVVGSRYMKEALAQTCPTTREIHVIRYAVPAPETPPAYREAVAGRVLFVGRITPQKGLLHLIRALALVRAPWTLNVNGDGYAMPAAQRLVSAMGLTDRIYFRGWTDGRQLEVDFQDASVVAVPSVWPEPFGLVGLEAMAWGRPVVAFNVGGIPEWLEDGVCGRLAAPGDVRGLARAIEELIVDRARAEEFGLSGFETAKTRFSPCGHVRGLLGLYAPLKHGFEPRSTDRSMALPDRTAGGVQT